MSMIESIQAHPKMAAIICLLNVIVAETMGAVQLPVIFMQCVQLVAWIVTITVGVITIIGWIKKSRK